MGDLHFVYKQSKKGLHLYPSLRKSASWPNVKKTAEITSRIKIAAMLATYCILFYFGSKPPKYPNNSRWRHIQHTSSKPTCISWHVPLVPFLKMRRMSWKNTFKKFYMEFIRPGSAPMLYGFFQTSGISPRLSWMNFKPTVSEQWACYSNWNLNKRKGNQFQAKTSWGIEEEGTNVQLEMKNVQGPLKGRACHALEFDVGLRVLFGMVTLLGLIWWLSCTYQK